MEGQTRYIKKEERKGRCKEDVTKGPSFKGRAHAGLGGQAGDNDRELGRERGPCVESSRKGEHVVRPPALL